MALRRDIITLAVFVIFKIHICMSEFNRQSFPKGFVFGTASSAFQVDFKYYFVVKSKSLNVIIIFTYEVESLILL